MVRIVVQRVRRAEVRVDETIIASIDRGLLLLVGIGVGDDLAIVRRLAEKIAVLRVFEDDAGKMNRSTRDVEGAMLAVSQFTLFGDLRKGRRPSFVRAAPAAVGEELYDAFCESLRACGYQVQQGRFGADMLVSLENDGPVTLLLDSEQL